MFVMPRTQITSNKFWESLTDVCDRWRLMIDPAEKQLHFDFTEKDLFFVARLSFPCVMSSKAVTPQSLNRGSSIFQRRRNKSSASETAVASDSHSYPTNSNPPPPPKSYYVRTSHFVTHLKRILKSKCQWQLRCTSDQLYLMDNVVPTYKYSATIEQLEARDHPEPIFFVDLSLNEFLQHGLYFHVRIPTDELLRMIVSHCIGNGTCYSHDTLTRTTNGKIQLTSRSSLGMNITHTLPLVSNPLDPNNKSTKDPVEVRTFFSLWLRFVAVCMSFKHIEFDVNVYANELGVFLQVQNTSMTPFVWSMHIHQGQNIEYLESF